jgi:hypothetical protein
VADTENTPFKEIVKNREPSKFFAKEMIFDCVRGHVSSSRASSIEKIIDQDSELKHIRNLVNIGSKYCSLLSKIEISEKLLNEINGTVNVVEKVRSTIVPRNWPIPVKWGIEAFIVSAIVAAGTLALFWTNIETLLPQKHEMVLAKEKIHNERDTNKPITDQTEIEEAHKTLARANPVEEAADEPVSAPASAPTPAPAPAPTPAPKAEVETKPAVAAAAPAPPISPKAKGYVYKQFMNLQNLESLAPEITAKIVELGGEKAGEVELGWKKPNGRYYHFVLPADSREILNSYLKSLGPLTEVKDPHVRVMPEGEERYILWIEGS